MIGDIECEDDQFSNTHDCLLGKGTYGNSHEINIVNHGLSTIWWTFKKKTNIKIVYLKIY